MGGHSHWANIKRKKGAADARRGKAWTKCSREISIAAKLGASGDPAQNPRLRKAMDDAKSVQMPADTIKRAIMRGTGELEGAAFEELTYEGYASGGVALIIDCTSDNRNRTRSEIHTVMAKNGGALGAPNSVAWMFKSKGLIVVGKEGAPSEDEVMGLVLDLGAARLQGRRRRLRDLHHAQRPRQDQGRARGQEDRRRLQSLNTGRYVAVAWLAMMLPACIIIISWPSCVCVCGGGVCVYI